MKNFFFLLLFFIGCVESQKQVAIYQLGLGPLTQVQVVSLVTDELKVNFKIAETGKNVPSIQKVKRMEGTSYQVIQAHLKNLKDLDYLVEVKWKGEMVDKRVFRPFHGKESPFRFVVASCLNDSDKFNEIQKIMWKSVEQQNPHALFLIGDNVYADNWKLGGSITIQNIWNRYGETFLKLDLYKQKKLVPILALWDDHDYGIDNGNRNFSLKKSSREAFKTFFGLEGPQVHHFSQEEGVGYFVSISGQDFYFLDNRWFRAKKGGQTHFGNEQEKWLMENLEKRKKPSWIISGGQFFGKYHPFESYEGNHGESFDNFLTKLGKIKSIFFFVSGDKHSSEVMKINDPRLNFSTYEFTSSAIHSHTNFPNKKDYKNKRRLYHLFLEPSFMVVHSKLNNAFSKEIKATVEFIGLQGTDFKKDFFLKR